MGPGISPGLFKWQLKKLPFLMTPRMLTILFWPYHIPYTLPKGSWKRTAILTDWQKIQWVSIFSVFPTSSASSFCLRIYPRFFTAEIRTKKIRWIFSQRVFLGCVCFYMEPEDISLLIVVSGQQNVHPKHFTTVMGVSADSTDFP